MTARSHIRSGKCLLQVTWWRYGTASSLPEPMPESVRAGRFRAWLLMTYPSPPDGGVLLFYRKHRKDWNTFDIDMKIWFNMNNSNIISHKFSLIVSLISLLRYLKTHSIIQKIIIVFPNLKINWLSKINSCAVAKVHKDVFLADWFWLNISLFFRMNKREKSAAERRIFPTSAVHFGYFLFPLFLPLREWYAMDTVVFFFTK